MVAGGLCDGISVSVRGKGKPAPKFGSSGAAVHEFHFGGEIPDQFVVLGTNRAAAVMRGSVVDSAGGHDAVDKFLVRLLSCEYWKKAFASEIGWRDSASDFDEGGKEIEMVFLEFFFLGQSEFAIEVCFYKHSFRNLRNLCVLHLNF